MPLEKIDPMTIRCREQGLPAVHPSRGILMGTRLGRRPDFDFPSAEVELTSDGPEKAMIDG